MVGNDEATAARGGNTIGNETRIAKILKRSASRHEPELSQDEPQRPRDELPPTTRHELGGFLAVEPLLSMQ